MSYEIPPIPSNWVDCICVGDYVRIVDILQNEPKNADIFPPAPLVWRALQLTPPHTIKVVIIGQDPYHAPNQAMGLAFSVPKGQKIPPSLQNIYRELYTDMGIPPAPHGDISTWAEQGVLLLNTVLTVRKAEANSHKNIGWENVTTNIIYHINAHYENIVFILWGRHAKFFCKYIDRQKHCILTAHHPSPLSANKGGFFGCKHFSKANTYLKNHGKTPINWGSHRDM